MTYRLLTIIIILLPAANLYNTDMISENQKKELEWDNIVNQVAQYGVLRDNQKKLREILHPNAAHNIRSTRNMQSNIQYLVNDNKKRNELAENLASIQDALSTIESFISDIERLKKDDTSIKNIGNIMTGSSYSMSVAGNILDNLAPRWIPKQMIYAIPCMFNIGLHAYFSYGIGKNGINALFTDDGYFNKAWNTTTSFLTLGGSISQITGNVRHLNTAYDICQKASCLFQTAQRIHEHVDVATNMHNTLGIKDHYTTCNNALPAYIRHEDGIDSFWKVYAWPRILTAYEQMAQKIYSVDSLIEYYRTLDAHLACARMIKEKKQYFTSVSFLEDREEPYIELNNLWTPEMFNGEPVKNDIYIDNQNRNMLISGPNGTGKTTVMKAIAHSIMLAQSIGFAPATHAHMTPFSDIETYLHLTEDGVSEGLSRFQAEALRISDIVGKLNRPGFTLCVMDEPLQGTAQGTAEDLVYELGKKLCNQTNTVAIIASHLEKPSQLEKENYAICNYHIETQENLKKEQFDITRKLRRGLDWWFSDPAKRLRFLKTFMPQQTDSGYSFFQSIITSAQEASKTA